MIKVQNEIEYLERKFSFSRVLMKGGRDKSHISLIIIGLLVCGCELILGVILDGSDLLVWSGLIFALLFLIWILFCMLQGSKLAFGIFSALFIIGLITLSGASEVGDAGALGINIPTLLRAILLASSLITGLWYLPKYWRSMFRRPLIWLTIMVIIAVSSSFYSSFKVYSFALSFSIFTTVLFFAIASLKAGGEIIVKSMFWTCTLVLIVSWLMFFVAPDIAVYTTTLWTGETVWRFEGLTNHPNTMGLVLGLYFGILLIMYYSKWISRQGFWLMFFLIVVSILSTDSKTAILATTLSSTYFISVQKSKISYLIWPAAIFFTLLALTFSFAPWIIESILIGLSRSGNANEVISLTGRLGLWLGAFEAIKAAPFLGYGYMSTRWVLAVFAPNTWEGMHAHNMIVEGLIFFGIIGTTFLMFIYLDSFILLMKKKSLMLAYFLPFTFLIGITETSILSRSLLFISLLTISLTLTSSQAQPKS